MTTSVWFKRCRVRTGPVHFGSECIHSQVLTQESSCRVPIDLENLEMSGNLKVESECQGKVNESQKNPVKVSEKSGKFF